MQDGQDERGNRRATEICIGKGKAEMNSFRYYSDLDRHPFTGERKVNFKAKVTEKERGYSVTDHRADNLLTIRKDGKENYFYIFGGKDERSQDLIQGITLAGVFFDEVALMPESFVKKERKVYLTDECAYHLRKYLLSRNDANPALFVSSKQPHTRLGKQAIQSMLRTLGQKTEIHAHPHKFRRTLLTDAGNRGIPLQEIQHYAGHEKPDTTMMYVTVSEENVRASFRRYIA